MSFKTNNIRSVWNVATWLRDHLDTPISIHSLASRTGLSERQFHRIFNAILGETPAAHIQRLRLERAAMWLVYTDFPVLDAALAGGYNSREGFSRIFHTRFGCSPCVFRLRARERGRKAFGRKPDGLGLPKEMSLPTVTVVAWPHIGSGLGAAQTWLKLGKWCRKNFCFASQFLPVSVLYDDEGITPSKHSRLDAALVVPAPEFELPDGIIPPFAYDLPGGRHVIVPYEGHVNHLERAWDYMAFHWLPVSGLFLRSARMRMLHEPGDVPFSSEDLIRLLFGRPIRCRLCIPVDTVPGEGLPPFSSAISNHASCL